MHEWDKEWNKVILSGKIRRKHLAALNSPIIQETIDLLDGAFGDSWKGCNYHQLCVKRKNGWRLQFVYVRDNVVVSDIENKL